MKDKILLMLKQTGNDYISGQKLSEELHVSRTAVWKQISKLRDADYQIESVNNRGYRLVESPDTVLPGEIQNGLKTAWLGKDIRYRARMDSTNMEIRRLADAGAQQGVLAVCEEQTHGRGRRGRRWESPYGTGIWMSFLLRPDILPDQSSMLTLVAALAVANALEEISGLTVQVKWPNDLLISGKKVCGILTEMSAKVNELEDVIVGIGMNVNTRDFPEELKKTATSVSMEMGADIARSSLIQKILEWFESMYQKFLEAKSLEPWLDEYNHRLIHREKMIRVICGQKEWIGRSNGIDMFGRLSVIDMENRKQEILSGEISLRGMDQYI